jgi:predicted peptidase
MGGSGSWYMAMQRPDRFAAAVPVCGGGNTAKAAALRSLPIWNFHGTDDTTVPVKFSRAMVEAVRAAGGKPLHTEYEGVRHNSWEWAYTEPALPDWLFAQHK